MKFFSFLSIILLTGLAHTNVSANPKSCVEKCSHVENPAHANKLLEHLKKEIGEKKDLNAVALRIVMHVKTPRSPKKDSIQDSLGCLRQCDDRNFLTFTIALLLHIPYNEANARVVELLAYIYSKLGILREGYDFDVRGVTEHKAGGKEPILHDHYHAYQRSDLYKFIKEGESTRRIHLQKKLDDSAMVNFDSNFKIFLKEHIRFLEKSLNNPESQSKESNKYLRIDLAKAKELMRTMEDALLPQGMDRYSPHLDKVAPENIYVFWLRRFISLTEARKSYEKYCGHKRSPHEENPKFMIRATNREGTKFDVKFDFSPICGKIINELPVLAHIEFTGFTDRNAKSLKLPIKIETLFDTLLHMLHRKVKKREHTIDVKSLPDSTGTIHPGKMKIILKEGILSTSAGILKRGIQKRFLGKKVLSEREKVEGQLKAFFDWVKAVLKTEEPDKLEAAERPFEECFVQTSDRTSSCMRIFGNPDSPGTDHYYLF